MKTPKRLQKLATRIDAMSLRERAFLFGSLALVMMAVADQAVIAPSLQQQAGWRSQLQRTQAELAVQREELARLSLPHLPGQLAGTTDEAGRKLAQLQRALAEARAAQAGISAQLQPPEGAHTRVALPELLEEVLQHHRGVTLVRLNTRPSSDGAAAKAGGRSLDATALVMAISPSASAALAPTAAAPLAPAAAPSAPAGLPAWQGAQLSVSGSFADLRAFLIELERQLPGLRWGTLILDADTSPPVMSIQLWLAGSKR
ncbi:MAG TPA: hypothetical protein VLA61_19840 [Ideonella sp.]|uniref:hypothetical protein n=1 Tax=Ideonella sp. TaxID=1929293 RepID=UPI002BB5454E|nr:hypothetical protein [Ideonella sp.]HSI50525.1 hypothetical protein [Ideonella sp.]